jgi:hypothetical protein
MKIKAGKILVLLPLLLLLNSAHGQVAIDLILSPTLQNAKVVYISSFDFLQQGAAEFLFQITINADQDTYGRMVFSVDRNGELLAEATTNDFNLPAGTFSMNNIQLSNGYVFPVTEGDRVQFDSQNIKSLDDDFKQEVNQGGKLPSGRYHMNVEFYQVENNIPGQEPIGFGSDEIEVVGGAYVLPITPGREGDLTNPDLIYNEFPVFQFNTDLYVASQQDEPFEVEVYKVLPDQHSSIDDVLTSTPHLRLITGQTLFQYPKAATDEAGFTIEEYQPLTLGTYVWRVVLNLQTTSGIDRIESPIFVFKLVDPSTVSEDIVKQATSAEVLAILRYLIGERADEYINMLSDYMLQEIRVDGAPIDIAGLYDRITQYTGKVIKIEYIELLGSQE